MRAFLLALALAVLPTAALAQPAGEPAALLQRIGIWAQQMAAAQQPVVEAYESCRPTMARVADMLKTEQRIKSNAAFASEMHGCIARLHAASAQTRDGLARLPPMPPEVDRALGLDSAAVLRRAVAAVDGTVGYLDRMNEAFEALQRDEPSVARAKMEEAQRLAGAVMDGQIVLMETLRQTLPLDTHKAMMDVRLAISRTIRVITISDALGGGTELAGELVVIRGQASAAAAQLRASWKQEGAGLHALVAGRSDTRVAQLAALDRAFAGLAEIGDALAALLKPAEAGSLAPAQAVTIIDGAALLEVRALELVKSFAAAAASK